VALGCLTALPLAATMLLAGAGPASSLPAPLTLSVATNGVDTANTCTNPRQPCLTLSHALSEATPGSTIEVGPGTFAGGIDIEENLTVVGSPSGTTISGCAAACGTFPGGVLTMGAYEAPTVTITDLTVTGGQNGVWIGGGTTTLNNVTVTGNSSSAFDGAGILVTIDLEGPGHLVMNGGSIVNNTYTGPGVGGGLFVVEATAVLNSVTVSNNHANGTEGGGIFDNGSLTLNPRSAVTNNTAVDGGGVEVCSDATANLSGALIANNSVNNVSSADPQAKCF